MHANGNNPTVSFNSVNKLDSSPRVYDGHPEDQVVVRGDGYNPTIFRRKVIRRVEEPVTRKVRVPVKVQVLQEYEYWTDVEVKKFKEVTREVPTTIQYTDLKPKKVYRDKVVWYPTTTTEEYVDYEMKQERVEVEKPFTKIVPEEIIQTVTVPTTRIVEEDGWRIDTVRGIRKVQYQEWQTFKLAPKTAKAEPQTPSREVELEVVSSSTIKGDFIYTKEQIEEKMKEVHIKEKDVIGRVRQSPTPTTTTYASYPFDMTKCLEYIRAHVSKKLREQTGKYIHDLEQEYKYFDRKLSGYFTADQLKQGVWFRDRSNKGIPVPQGPLRDKLQEQIDGVLRVCKKQGIVTFWEFAQYLLTLKFGPKLKIERPSKSGPWGTV